MRRTTAMGALLAAAVLLGGCPPSPVGPEVDTGVGTTDGGATEGGSVEEDASEAVDASDAVDVVVAMDVTTVPDAEPPSDGASGPDVPLLPNPGPLGDPPWVSLDVRTGMPCTPLRACGGDEAGVWDVSGGCVEVLIEDTVRMCPTARITSATGRARGRVNFSSGIAARAAEWEVEVSIFVPALCASLVGRCEGLERLLQSAAPTARCTTEGRGDCACTARENGRIGDGDAYETTDTQLVSRTSGKRWDYCVEGTTLRYQDRSSTAPREPGIVQLTRRTP